METNELKVGQPVKIQYTNRLGEGSERTIVPTFVPLPNIKAIDVSDLAEDQQAEIAEFLKEYHEYVKEFQSSMFDFTTWLEHTKQVQFEAKWRTFKIENVTVAD